MENIRAPASILLQVLLFSDVPTIQSFRLTSKAMRSLINTYETSICTTVLSQCFTDHELERYRPLYETRQSIKLLLRVHNRIRISKWLAGVAVEHHDDVHSGRSSPANTENISAQDPYGDPIRAHVENGWSVLWHLSDISQFIINNGDDSEFKENNGRLDFDEVILQARIKFLKDLPYEDRNDYLIMKMYLSPAFYDLELEDRDYFQPGDEEDPGYYEDELNILGKHWLAWIYLEKGPRFFQKAWSSVEGNRECSRLIYEQWQSRTPKDLQSRHKAAEEIYNILTDQEEEDELDDAATVIRRLTDFDDDPPRPVHSFRNIPFRLGST